MVEEAPQVPQLDLVVPVVGSRPELDLLDLGLLLPGGAPPASSCSAGTGTFRSPSTGRRADRRWGTSRPRRSPAARLPPAPRPRRRSRAGSRPRRSTGAFRPGSRHLRDCAFPLRCSLPHYRDPCLPCPARCPAPLGRRIILARSGILNPRSRRDMCAVGFSPCPRMWLRGGKSAGNPLEPTPNHGRTPPPRGGGGGKISRPPLYTLYIKRLRTAPGAPSNAGAFITLRNRVRAGEPRLGRIGAAPAAAVLGTARPGDGASWGRRVLGTRASRPQIGRQERWASTSGRKAVSVKWSCGRPFRALRSRPRSGRVRPAEAAACGVPDRPCASG